MTNEIPLPNAAGRRLPRKPDGPPRVRPLHLPDPTYQFVIDQWCEVNGYRREAFVSQFRDQITGRMMYDILFAYDPWWTERSRQ